MPQPAIGQPVLPHVETIAFAAEQISGFLQAVGLAKTAPKLEGLFDPKFVNDAN
jgi:hypothetical protein